MTGMWLLCTSGVTLMRGGIGSIGSGADYALGALRVLVPRIGPMPDEHQVGAVRTAVSIASEFDVHSGDAPLVMSIP